MEHVLPGWNEKLPPEVRGYGRTQPRLSSRGVFFTLLALAFLIASCGGDDAKPAPTPPNTQADGRTPISFVAKSGKKPTLYAEIAQTIPQLNVGLSKRDSMPP